MKNITQEIKNAINQNILWSVKIFFDFIEKLRVEEIEVSYWEGEENWATLGVENIPIGYLWKKYPLMFIQSNYLNTFKDIMETNAYLSVVVVDDLNAKVLEIDYLNLKDFFEYGIDYSELSVTDLWFQTNSI